MIEEIITYAILLTSKLIRFDEYNKWLNKSFLLHPDNEMLLNLQWCLIDIDQTIDIIYDNKVDKDVFGKILFRELEIIYNKTNIAFFNKRAYYIWGLLPNRIKMEKPYNILFNADDMLSRGKEKKARKLYKKMFRYYENT